MTVLTQLANTDVESDISPKCFCQLTRLTGTLLEWFLG